MSAQHCLTDEQRLEIRWMPGFRAGANEADITAYEDAIFAAGHAAALDGAEVEWGLQAPHTDTVYPWAGNERGARARSADTGGAFVVCSRTVTPWRPA